MTKFFSFVLILAVTFMMTDISAQGRGGDQLTISNVSKNVPTQVDQVMDLLYDQTANGNLNGYTSQDFEASFDPYDNQAADDFTATADWSIDQIVVTGSYSVAGPAAGFNIYFYTNNGGMPGTEVYNAPSQAYTYDAGTGMFTITLANPAVLPAGDYWVSVQCRMDFGTAGQWYWNQVDGSYGNVAQWQNPGGGFGTTCSTWGNIQGCIGAIGTDMYFALYGTIPPPPTGFFDDFDSYTAGQQLACQNPNDWTTWNLNPCDALTDAYVSSNYAHSGANSFVVVADNDEVHYWGPETSGLWEIDFYNYIPSGKTGYFNTLGQFVATQEWGLEVYFNAGGAGSINAGGTGAASFTYVYDAWALNQVIVNLDTDQAEYWYNGTMIYQWQWTLGSNGVPIALSLAANDFYGAAATDEMYVDDYGVGIVPVELTSFTANVVNGNVRLDWSTATETNNRGFEVQKMFGNEFQTIAFVEGNGTSTQQHTYSYIDNSVANGNYSYRLRQVDFDGTSEYSPIVEVTVDRPAEYNLAQNYPNPFNPSTKINYGLKVDSKVTLKVFDILGQEVVTLLNGNIAAGNHTVTFDASKLNSGVYLYKIEATGVDGSSFTSVKKMILTK